MKKRIFSLLMAVCLIFNFVPLSAFAADSDIAMQAVEAVVNEATTTASDATPPQKGETTPLSVNENGAVSSIIEEKLCSCTEKCTAADEKNSIPAGIDLTCPMCSAAGADLSLCKGMPPAAMMMGVSPRASTSWGSGDGSAADKAYEISTVVGLQDLASGVNGGNTYENKFFKLTANIDLNGAEWTPIGTYVDGTQDKPFKGTFDGGNFEVQNLKINAPSANSQGLFGYIGSGGVVKNVGVAGTVSGTGSVGGVVGTNAGAVESCYNKATVSGAALVGGVVGNNYGTVQSCYNTGAVSGTGDNVGGIAGYNVTTVQSCYNTGTVSGTGNNVGGITGYNEGAVQSCYNTGTVSGTASVGGVVGANTKTVQSCVSLGASVVHTGVGADTAFGRVVGANTGGTLSGNKARIDMVVNGVVLRGNAATVGGDKIDGETVAVGIGVFQDNVFTAAMGFADADGWGTINHIDLAENAALPTLKGFTASQSPTLPAGVEPWEGEGTSGKPYLIKAVVDLQNLATKINNDNVQNGYKDKHFKMCNIIDVASAGNWVSIGQSATNSRTVAFEGIFDGGGFEVQNLKIDAPTTNGQGLFSYVGTNGVVKKLGVTGTISGKEFVGGVVGVNEDATAIVKNCYNTGAVSGTGDNVGGVVSYNIGIVQNSYNTGAVNGASYVGGVAGSNIGKVQSCVSLGASVVGTGTDLGRVVGVNSGTLTGNKARNDMSVNGAVVSSGATIVGDKIDGETVTVADATTQSSVFANGDFTNTFIWTIPKDGKLVFNAKLPKLVGFNPDNQDPILPEGKKDISTSIIFDGGSAVYNGSVQKHEKANYTQGTGGTFAYAYTTTNGTLDNGEPKGAGTYTVTATYTSTTEKGSKTASFTITPKPLTAKAVSVSNDSFIYDGKVKTPTSIIVADGSTKLILSTDYTFGLADNINAGAAKVNVSFIGNYRGTATVGFTIGKAPLTISGGAVSEKTYDGTNIATVTSLNFYDANNVIAFASDNYTVGAPTFDTADVGTSINVKGIAALANTATANNYTLADGAYTLKGDIVKGNYAAPPSKTINIKNNAVRTGTITLADVFGGNIPAGSAFGTITAQGTPSIMAGVTLSGNNLIYTSQNNTGTNAQDVYIVKVTAKNYNDFDVNITFKAIDKTAVTIQGITPQAWLSYSGKPQKGYTGNATVTGGNVNVNELVYTYSGTGGTSYNSATAPTDAGSYTLVVSVPGSNTAYAGSTSIDFSIAQAPLIITAASYEIYRYKKAPELTAQANALAYNGFVNGEGTSVLGAKYFAAYAKAVDTTQPGTTDIDIGFTGTQANTNYAITTVKGKLTVHEALPTGSITTALPTAPATDPAVVAEANGSKTLRLIIGDLMPTEQVQTEKWLDNTIGVENLRASHEVELQVSEDGGITWRAAKEEDIKNGKARAVLPLPTNTSPLTHDLFVYHFASGADKEPTREATIYNEKANALIAEVTGFSPFVIVAIPKEADKPITPPTPPTGGTDSSDDENQFWISVVTLIQGAKKDDVLKIDTGVYTNMPACVMEELRIKGAGMIIKRNSGKEIIIPSGKAQNAEKNRAIWTLAELERLYNKYSLGNKTNPNTGVKAYDIVNNETGVTTPITGNIVEATATQSSQTGIYSLAISAGLLLTVISVMGVCIWIRKKEKDEE